MVTPSDGLGSAHLDMVINYNLDFRLGWFIFQTSISATKKGTRGGLGPPRRSQICHQKVPNLTSEGPKLYLRSKNGLKKEENAWLCLHNASLEGPELFGPPKILAQLRLCWWDWNRFLTQGSLYSYFLIPTLGTIIDQPATLIRINL